MVVRSRRRTVQFALTLLLEGRFGGPAADDEEPVEFIVATGRPYRSLLRYGYQDESYILQREHSSAARRYQRIAQAVEFLCEQVEIAANQHARRASVV